MSDILVLRDLSLRLRESGRPILEHFSFTLRPGDRAVLIGEEGNGKSTLLRALAEPAHIPTHCELSGEILLRGRVGYLPQILPEALRSRSLHAYFADFPAHEAAALCTRLGLPPALCTDTRTLATLSGGERVKVQLAHLLLEEPDVLLLDEPTNDLDIQTLGWLEELLLRTPLPVLYVSHDEILIEHTANVIIHMEQLRRKTQCRTTVARCGYREYIQTRTAQFAHQTQVARKQREEQRTQQEQWQQVYQRVEHDLRTISRGDPHGAKLLKKKMKTLKSQEKRFEREKEEFLEIPETEEAILAQFPADIRLSAGKTVLDYSLDALCVEGRVLARDIHLHVAGGEHIGITGRNGAGKSTLLALLWDALRVRPDLQARWMPQDYSLLLDYGKTPIEHLGAQYDKESLTRARTYLGSMRFTHGEMTGRIGALSGGQRAKLLYLDMVLQRADVLLLDEPTRNFSPLSCPAVREALRAFGGTIISVSHDRKYLQEVCDSVYVLDADGLHRQN